ncbi:hypothetical protein PJP10_31740, partial [Mycobacterium kansasii]
MVFLSPWIIDTRATSHMTGKSHQFSSYLPSNQSHFVTITDEN